MSQRRATSSSDQLVSRSCRYAEHDMYMVAHDRKSVNADGKNLAQLLNTSFDDRFAVFEGFATVTVDPAKPGAPHTARNAVVGTSLAGFKQVSARRGHGGDGGCAHDGRL